MSTTRAATKPWKVLQGPENVSWPNFIEKGNGYCATHRTFS
jgi:hypothetical protein